MCLTHCLPLNNVLPAQLPLSLETLENKWIFFAIVIFSFSFNSLTFHIIWELFIFGTQCPYLSWETFFFSLLSVYVINTGNKSILVDLQSQEHRTQDRCDLINMYWKNKEVKCMITNCLSHRPQSGKKIKALI